MLKYIINKMLTERKYTIGNIVLYSCINSMLMVCMSIVMNINVITSNENYKDGLLAVKISDPFIREKMNAIFMIMNMVSIILIIFFGILYFWKLKSDIINERQRIAMFEVLGYSSYRRGMTIFMAKILELIIPTIIGILIASCIWSGLNKQEAFNTLMTILDDKIDFELKCVAPVMIIMISILFIGSMSMMKRETNIVSDLKGEE